MVCVEICLISLAFDKKENAVLMGLDLKGQPVVLGRKIGHPAARVKTNDTITSHSLVYSSDSRPCNSTCPKWLAFVIYLGKLFILLTNTTLNRFGIGMLAVRIALFHWLYFYYIS